MQTHAYLPTAQLVARAQRVVQQALRSLFATQYQVTPIVNEASDLSYPPLVCAHMNYPNGTTIFAKLPHAITNI